MAVSVFHGSPAIEVGLGGLRRLAYLRPLTGLDEDSVEGTDTGSAVALLDRLLIAGPGGAAQGGEAGHLSAGQRDRLFAALQVRTFGPRIASTLACRHCGQDFDIAFALPDLVAHVQAEAARDAVMRPDGCIAYRGLSFRLPSAFDEAAVAALPPAEARAALMIRCLGGDDASRWPAVEAAMGAADPLLDRDLPARCAECGTLDRLHFSIQAYFLGSLLGEKRRLVEEVHALAAAYGWSRESVLSMRRSVRRDHVALLAAAGRRRSA